MTNLLSSGVSKMLLFEFILKYNAIIVLDYFVIIKYYSKLYHMAMSLNERDKYIRQITSQINQKEKLITHKMKELNISKKDNMLLEKIYMDNAKQIKQVKQNTVNALKILANYLSKLNVEDEDIHEKDNDIKIVLKEINKHK